MARRVRDRERIDLGTVTATPMRERGLDEQGRPYWRARAAEDRRTVWTGWGTWEEATAAINALIGRGLPASRRAAPARTDGVRTVGDLVEQWGAYQGKRLESAEIAKSTHGSYIVSAGYWRASIGDVLVGAVTRDMVDSTAREWRLDEVAPRTVEQAIKVLGIVFAWGAERGHCRPLDVSGIAAGDVDDEEFVYCDRTPERHEVAAVMPHLPERDAVVVELLAITGARISEVGALRVGSWDRARDVLRLTGRDPARKRRGKVRMREWPLTARLRSLLERLAGDRAADEPLVVGLPASPGTFGSGVRLALVAACELAKVPRFTPHGLRRMVALELLDATDPKTVSKLTGHSVQTLLARYIRPTPARLRDVVERSQSAAPLRVVGAQSAGTGGDNDG